MKAEFIQSTQSTSGTIDVQGILQIAFGEEKNALEPFVERRFANLRQKCRLYAYLQIRNKNIFL